MRVPTAPTRGKGDRTDSRGGSPRRQRAAGHHEGLITAPSSRSSNFKGGIPCLACGSEHRCAVGATTGALAAGAFAGLGPVALNASSHREAPLVSADPRSTTTDLYAFVSPDRPQHGLVRQLLDPVRGTGRRAQLLPLGRATRTTTSTSTTTATRPPTSSTGGRFTTHHRNADSFIYNNGPVTSLDDENLLVYQTYDLTRIKRRQRQAAANDALVASRNVGQASMPDYNADLFDAGVRSPPATSSSSWVGQTDDPFFLDLRVFDLLYGGNLSEAGDDTLDGFNVNTIACRSRRSSSVARTTA